jgi:hypothetical protein
VVKCTTKNGHQKDMCLKGNGLHVQNMLTIVGSIVNIIGPREEGGARGGGG